MKNSHIHAVYGYESNTVTNPHAPKVMGFGKSDKRALADAQAKGGDALFYFFIRSNGEMVPAASFATELLAKLGQ